MQHLTVRICLLLLLLHHLTSVKEEESVQVEVIVDSSPCSATCGLGVKTQTVCLMKDGEKATKAVTSKDGTEVSQDCRVRRVKCLQSWRCGLSTMTVTSGQRVELDCLEEVMKAMGRFSWRLSWRYTRGIITSDDSLFIRWDAPLLDRVILNPVREEDAGTYCCTVQDVTLRRVKRACWGIRVLPARVLNLNHESSQARWESTGKQQNDTASHQIYTMVITLSLSSLAVGILLAGLYLAVRNLEYLDRNAENDNKYQSNNAVKR
ncbi:transmembrane protein 81 isoform X1 [Pungitius pungitius]|uniref:transmembrane protein 81 isoform X1 n=1 Tax=Pungitius pungitius TaxID=134920 RepID=UPI002E12EAF4